ncbi:GIY-YIG nuclease family protein [Prochlorococcus marinus]|uniref:GIY-YIG nuclease family protein n=1 Tax=Prochlorococcus marinus TaxID=1219 RepID=UPI0022B3D962|nr:GIY-YIG nuclease family protein [Prochlorococcus marinus]
MKNASPKSILNEIRRIEDIPGFVYVIRNKDLYKIGITVSIKRRVKELKPDEVVAVKEASNIRGIEKLLHKRYKHCRVPQTEYFRLNNEEVIEVINLLGGEVASSYSIAPSIQKELQQLEKIAKRKVKFKLTPEIQSVIDELQDTIFNSYSGESLWEEVPLIENGIEIGRESSYFAYAKIKAESPDIDIKVPLSEDLLNAIERLWSREDLFLSVARAETADEAQESANEILRDFLLILCWGYWEGSITLSSDGESSARSHVEIMEDTLRSLGVWYTTESPAKRRELEALKGWRSKKLKSLF